MPEREADRREIEGLIFRYADLVDAGDFEGLGELLSECSLVGPDTAVLARGRDAVRALYERTTRRYPDDGTPHTRHVTTNLVVDFEEGDCARARSSFTVFQALPDFPLQAIIVGRYDDQFIRIDGRWCFRSRAMLPELLGDLSRHLLVDPPR